MSCSQYHGTDYYHIGNAAYCRVCHRYVEPDRARNVAVMVLCAVGIVAIFLLIFLEPLINP